MSENDKSRAPRGVRRIPQQSLLYEKIVPLALVVMAIVMLGIILAALGILFGLIPL